MITRKNLINNMAVCMAMNSSLNIYWDQGLSFQQFFF